MKKRLLNIELILITFFVGNCYTANGQVIVRGYIYNSSQHQIMLPEPINGFSNSRIFKTEWGKQLDSKHYFERKINLEKANMLTLFVGTEPIWIFAEPNDTIEVFVDFSKFTNSSPNGGIIFKGRNSKGNEYFNSFNFQPGKKFADFEFIMDSTGFREKYDLSKIDIGFSNLIAPFDSLLKENKITPAFYNDVVPGIKQALLTKLIRYLVDSKKEMSYKRSLEIAEKIYKKYPVTTETIQHSLFGSLIASYYYETIARKNYTGNLTDSIIQLNDKKLFINSNFLPWLYAPKEIQETLWPLSLINLKKLFADHYSSRDVEAFLTLHPDSPIKQYLVPPYFDNTDLSSIVLDTLLYKFIDDTISNNFSDFIQKNLKGKKILVDFWATWCVPCKQEFQYNKTVDSFCNKYGIARLYISFDEPETQGSLLKNISAYNLHGYHIAASKNLFKNIVENFYPDGQFSIPRYLLIDQNGTVVNSAAPRPSSGNELLNIMKEDLNIKN